jgi:hypothetical protein
MTRHSRVVAVMFCGLLLPLAGAVDAQRRSGDRHPAHPPPAGAVRGHVFVGGYFYDPFFGAYPWWPRTAYPVWYGPIYDRHAEIRLRVDPPEAKNAAVYVDGFYAGIVDDFNGVFQALPLTPGSHRVVLYLDGYRTAQHNLYLSAGSTMKLRETMQRLRPGEVSEAPELAPPVPPPPAGSYRGPATPPRYPLRPGAPVTAAGFGTIDIYVQPTSATVTIDGQRWVSSEQGHFIVQVPAGTHQVEVESQGLRRFASDVDVREGETCRVNVSLSTTS